MRAAGGSSGPPEGGTTNEEARLRRLPERLRFGKNSCSFTEENTWADQGPAGNDFSQGSAAQQPQLVAGAIGGNNLPPFGIERWDRVWFLDETGGLDALLTFDFSDAGLAFLGLPPNYDLALLYSETDALGFSILNWDPTINGDQVSFFVPDGLLRDGYYTLGTTFIPEPGTLSLLALGGLGMLIRRRRSA